MEENWVLARLGMSGPMAKSGKLDWSLSKMGCAPDEGTTKAQELAWV